MPRRYWLMKTEPDVFGWDHLLALPKRTTAWDGVRNYSARNLLRDEIRVGDEVFFYHSRCNPPHIAGLAVVVRSGYPDPTQFDARSKYYDPKSTRDDPRWFVVDVQARRKLKRPIGLPELKATPALSTMMVTRRGARLSVQPVTSAEWKAVLALENRPAPA